MSEKRPETTQDIVTRSRRVGVDDTPPRRRRRKHYSVDLSSHMAECDGNYHRLMRLFPKLREQPEKTFSLPLMGYATVVEFTVAEKGPYTTLLEIKVDADNTWARLATGVDLVVRIYHDAQSAEVVSYQNERRFLSKYEYPNRDMRQRDEKVQVNRFLREFLELCLEHGSSDAPIEF